MRRYKALLRIVFAAVLLLWSWLVMLQRASNTRRLSSRKKLMIEFFSIFLAMTAYFVLFYSFSSKHEANRRCSYQRILHFCLVVCSSWVILTHVVIFLLIPPNHQQTRELMLILTRVVSDTALFLFGACLSLGAFSEKCQWCYRVYFNAEPKNHGFSWRRQWWVAILALLGLLAMAASSVSLTGDAAFHLNVGMLGDRVDVCGFEGLRLSTEVATSWVIPEYTPRRALNFYTGSDQCGSNKISFLDEEEGTLIVLPTCPDGKEQPTIFLERPEESEYNGGPEEIMMVRRSSKEWHKILEERYGKDEAFHQAMGVRVNRNSGNVIQSVQLLSSTLKRKLRTPRTTAEHRARTGWLSEEVWEIPLGASAAYTVYCPASTHEEYHMFPPPRHHNQPKPNTTAGESSAARPPANVVILIFDAVSRQEVGRSLPQFSAWLRKFRDTASSHHFVEAQGATTLGHSTSGNLGPLLLGSGHHFEPKMKKNYHKTNLYYLAKQRYGDLISTSYTIGDCLDPMHDIFQRENFSAGFGEPISGLLDYHTFGPFCHMQYSALSSNFQGPNSILKRCIGQRYVHEYVLDYARTLVGRRLKNRQRTEQGSFSPHDRAPHFFDVFHLVEGHEGTHGVVYLVDNALTAFLEDLKTRLHFFDDPSNVLVVLSDHGSHMGHYYELFKAGKMERSLPFIGMILHQDILTEMDRMKDQPSGAALQNLKQRTRRISTHLDMYLTLADLLGVTGKVAARARGLRVSPASLFDRRATDVKATKCTDVGALTGEASGCFLTWCAK